jgi:nitrogen-specific signal transduction histidine kinase/DNA-binding response OmpR family regulator
MIAEQDDSKHPPQLSILVLSEDPKLIVPLTAELAGVDIAADQARTAAEVLNRFAEGRYPLLLVDTDGCGGESDDLITTIRKSHPQCLVVVAASEPSIDLLCSLIRLGTYDFQKKPLDVKQLAATIRFACRKRMIAEAKAEVFDRLKRSTALLDKNQVELHQQAFRVNEELQNLNKALRRHVSQLTILYQMGRDISENENWSDALDRFLMALVNYLNAGGAAVLLFSDHHRRLAARANFQVDEDTIRRACADLLTGWLSHLRGSEMHSLEGYREAAFDTCLERVRPWRHTLIPLRHRSRPLGFLLLEKSYPTNQSFKIDYHFLNTIQTIFAEEVANASYISQLRQLSRFNEKVLDNINSGVITTDATGRVRFFNQQARHLCPQLAGSEPVHFDDLFRSPTFGDGFFDKLLNSRKDTHLLEVECSGADGRPSPARLNTGKMRDDNLNTEVIVAIFEDLTEQKRMESEIRRHDRLRVLGQLSAGVAHEIRNPLTGIATSVELLGSKLKGDEDKTKYITAVLSEINRLDGIIRNLLSFARPAKPRLSRCSLTEIANRVINLLSDQARRKEIKLVLTAKMRDEGCYADPDQITQVLLNLVLNAIQACDRGDRIDVILSEEMVRAPQEDHFARVDVIDTGPGIPESIRDNLFEPFITTKTKGSGLGLAISQQIIEEHGGRIVCDTAPGRTRFSVFLSGGSREAAGVAPNRSQGS